jgi:glycosyltransferase involved in cell wall biosynthesis
MAKIALVYEFLSEAGGLERLMVNHAEFLIEEGHEVLILIAHKGLKIDDILPKSSKLEVIEIPKFKTKNQIWNMATSFFGMNILNKINPDLFITYSFPANFLIKNKIQKKIDYLSHFPNFLYLPRKDLKKWAIGIERKLAIILRILMGNYLRKLDKKIIKKNSLILANSNFTKKRVNKLYRENIVVNFPSISKNIKLSKNLFEEKFVFSCGRIIPDKKYELAIDALALTTTKYPFYLSGPGNKEYVNTLLKYAKKKGVNLKYLGKVSTEKLIQFYSSAQVFLFPTPEEDFGMVPAESLICGTPCIVWGDSAGPTEQIIDGLNGFHAKPYDISDFAKKIDKIINTNFKEKNKKKIISSAKKFSAKEIKKFFINEVNKVLKN